MENINRDITLNHSPFYDNLLFDLGSVADQKKRILKKVRSKAELEEKLSFIERQNLKHLMDRESKILIQLIELKGWSLNAFNTNNKDNRSIETFEDSDYNNPEFFNF